ncbi:MAG: hypothetical protein ACPIG6_09875 [Akkermansiaceae bacterium]
MIERIPNIDGSIRRIYHLSDYLPDDLRSSTDKIKGSDGVERTLAEWWDYILERTVFADASNPVTEALINLRQELVDAVHLRGDHFGNFKKAAGKYMQAALLECIEKGKTEKRVIDLFMSKVESLGRSLDNTKFDTPGRANLGKCILHYIEEHHELPTSVKAILECGKKNDIKISQSTAYDSLEWFKLKGVIKTNNKG